MARLFFGLGVLISAAVGGLILAAPAGAGDRFGPDANAGYPPASATDEREAVDPYAVQDRVIGPGRGDGRVYEHIDRSYGEGDGRYGERRMVRVYRGGDEVEAVDPYAMQDRVIRRDRGYDDGRYVRSERIYEEDRGYGRARVVTEHDGGAGWGYETVRGGYDGDGYAYGRVIRSYPEGDVWRTREIYGYGASACGACNAPYTPCGVCGVRYYGGCVVERCGVVQTESLPEDFFISEGGVGPGIVDFGGGGGGFAFSDSFASASASANASASASVRLKLSIMGHNHMHHFPHGCGCRGGKKW